MLSFDYSERIVRPADLSVICELLRHSELPDDDDDDDRESDVSNFSAEKPESSEPLVCFYRDSTLIRFINKVLEYIIIHAIPSRAT
jgi:hypothetical protein